MKQKRYSPLVILFDLWSFVKNSFIIVIYLFIIKASSDSLLIKYGQIAFLIFTICSIIYILLSWLTIKYELDEDSFHLYKGLVNKREQTIPFSKIQNVNKQTTLLHKLFKTTSLHFETGIAGEDSTVTFEVISQKEAVAIEAHIAEASKVLAFTDDELRNKLHTNLNVAQEENINNNRTVHFTPTKKELIKASFTSFSFLMLIPFIGTAYLKVDEIFQVKDATETVFTKIFNSTSVILLIVVIFVVASVLFGVGRTFLKYGKYEISSDNKRIYISKGILNEVDFSIEKDKVQAIQLNQSFIKRILNLIEVKLISAGNIEIEDNSNEVSVLYPFLSVKNAHHLINDILPSYEIIHSMNRLPRKSLIVKLLNQCLFWIIVMFCLMFFKNYFGSYDYLWWLIPLSLLIITFIIKLLEFINTRYVLNGEFVQFKKGSISTTLFLTKREKIIEVKVTKNVFQKFFDLASIETVNRAKPLHFDGVKDIPSELAQYFIQWYCNRLDEVEIDKR